MYLCTIDFLFDWFGLVCFANKEVNSTVILPLLYSLVTDSFFFRYKENPNIAHESAHAQAREALKKYLHYFERVSYTKFSHAGVSSV